MLCRRHTLCRPRRGRQRQVLPRRLSLGWPFLKQVLERLKPKMFRVKLSCPTVGIFLTSVALGFTAASLLFSPISGPVDLERAKQGSHIVVDRNGVLLRAFTTPDGRWRLPVRTVEVDPRFLAMLVAYEDQRFYRHHGVDLLSLGRAALQWASHGHIVSGGSTLTMQVARLLAPRAEKSVGAKLDQIVRALRLE